MLQNMATSLILHKRIHTTLAKAKALRTYIEPLLTKSKEDSTHSRRIVFSELQSKEAVTELFRDISIKIADRPGGYTRIIKIGNRLGDNAELCMMELVDYNENLLGGKQAKAKATRKRRGAGKKKTEEIAAAIPVGEVVTEKIEDAIQEEGTAVTPEVIEATETTDELKTEAENPVEEQNTENTEGESK
jgi:large subunit ribosomal protein L17